jgi:hypothetical protein
MAENNFNIGNAGQLITGTFTVHGTNIGTQINHAPDTEAADLTKELEELIASLEPTIPDLNSAAGQEALKTATLQEIEKNISLKTRLIKGAKAGLITYIQESANRPIVKAVISAFQAAFPEKK